MFFRIFVTKIYTIYKKPFSFQKEKAKSMSQVLVHVSNPSSTMRHYSHE